jgi:hypothetical protein
MARAAALALLVFSFMVGDAQATQIFRVYAVDRPLQDFPGGAEGLLVPGAGPETSYESAIAELTRGKVENSLRGGMPDGAPLIRLSPASEQPKAPYILVSVPRGGLQANDRRYPVVVVGKGFDGVLLSDSTRIPGLVSIADIAPTALGEEGSLRSRPQAGAVSFLSDLDARIDGHNDVRLPASILAGILILLLALWRPRAGLLGFGVVLVANLALGIAQVSSFWPVQIAIALAALSGLLLERVLRSDLELGSFLAGIVLAYLVALGVDGSAVALSPFGPTQNARFYGVSNLLETMLLVPGLAGAYFLRRRFGWAAFTGVGLLTFVAIAGNRFGADGGGAIVIVVAFALLAVLLAGLRGRRLALVLGGILLFGAALVALDAAFGPSSHVTRALDSGPGGLLGDLRDRIELSWDRIVHKASVTVVVAVCVPVLVFLVVRVLRSGAPMARRALPLAFAAALAVSLLVNDSPNDVLTAGLVGFVVMQVVMLRDRCAAPVHWPESSPPPHSSPRAAVPRRS